MFKSCFYGLGKQAFNPHAYGWVLTGMVFSPAGGTALDGSLSSVAFTDLLTAISGPSTKIIPACPLNNCE